MEWSGFLTPGHRLRWLRLWGRVFLLAPLIGGCQFGGGPTGSRSGLVFTSMRPGTVGEWCESYRGGPAQECSGTSVSARRNTSSSARSRSRQSTEPLNRYVWLSIDGWLRLCGSSKGPRYAAGGIRKSAGSSGSSSFRTEERPISIASTPTSCTGKYLRASGLLLFEAPGPDIARTGMDSREPVPDSSGFDMAFVE